MSLTILLRVCNCEGAGLVSPINCQSNPNGDFSIEDLNLFWSLQPKSRKLATHECILMMTVLDIQSISSPQKQSTAGDQAVISAIYRRGSKG